MIMNCVFCNNQLELCQVCGGKECETPICYGDLEKYWSFNHTHKISGKLLSKQQIRWLLDVGRICRGSYDNARYASSWISDILVGKDMTEEFKDYD